MSTTIFHSATTRFQTDRGWVKGKHSFNFGPYFESSRQAFGSLIIFNEDTVIPGAGFATHPHANMEIISIPLSGSIQHKDDTGKEATIKTGEIQIMSAGTGIRHSESNPSHTNELRFLQIWITPNKAGVPPRYQQIALNDQPNRFNQVVSPNPKDEGLWIQQDAWLHTGQFDKDVAATYHLKKEGNGIYIFVISGEISVKDQLLQYGDALSITETHEIRITAQKTSQVLIIEVPLK
ncbi:pirin [Flavobacterium rivuli WB 3.3-2 = DSM 21788]|uniref:Pirin n=1 Tax=Flavobacterium rivuli WB 3.3-2 = DSM 21788 TaxID=1121895 RepID=A0A0A2M360_9FLAO|nr:pirin family protein [Flavobacterium rivuli]KGO86664.1 pirin [Flavobacterium rivuli WB 3.3-2 = DSM 21788]